MIILAMTAFAASLACSGAENADCLMLTEVSTRARIHRRSCSGLDPIEKLYSVNTEGWLVCLPLSSLVAGPAAQRIPAAAPLNPPMSSEPNPPAVAPGN